jgi:hypothetical protein
MYIPTQEQISDVPEFNSFFRAPKGSYPLVSRIATSARQNAGIEESSYTWKTIRAIAASPWNRSHIKYSKTGYENYNIEGPQYTARYSLEPLAQPGSGNNFPVMWIPDPDNPLDPDIILQANVNIQAEAVKEIPLDVIEEVANPTRPVIIIEPETAEAAEIALSIDDLPTDKEAAVIEAAAALATDAQNILADPNATGSEKRAAVEAIAEMVADSGAVDPIALEAEKQEAMEAIDAFEETRIELETAPIYTQTDDPAAPGMAAILGPLLTMALLAYTVS